MRHAAWLLLVSWGCQGDDGEPSGPGGTDDTSLASDATGSAVVSRRAELVTWLGFEVSLDGASSAQLLCQSSDAPDEVHAIDVGPGEYGLHGLLGDHPYRCRLEANGVELWAEDVRTDPLPAVLPALALSGSGPSDIGGGYLMFSPWREGEQIRRAMIVDGQARIRWYLVLDAKSAGVTATYVDGEVLAGGGQGLPPTLYDLDGVRGFQSPFPPNPLASHHHEARRVPEGLLGLMSEELKFDHDGDGVLDDHVGFRVQVHDPDTGALVWDYNAADHIDSWEPLDDDFDPYHINAVTWEPDGTSWVSARAMNQVRLLDRSTGKVTHVMGRDGDMALLDASGAPLGDTAWFAGQHGPEVHGDRFFLMDNGIPQRGYSRAVEYRIDLVAREAREVWSWQEPGWFDPYFGNVSLLPSDHVLVASGHCDDCIGSGGDDRQAFVAEVDPATNEVVWRMDFVDPKQSIFRAQYLDGCEVFANRSTCPTSR